MNMKILIALLFIPLLLASCEEDNYGYPSKMTFEREGGTKFCSGKYSCYSMGIKNYNGIGATSKGKAMDSIKVTYDWLTVKCRRFGTQLEVIAAPNPSGKKRTLYVSPWIDNSFADIKVVQY